MLMNGSKLEKLEMQTSLKTKKLGRKVKFGSSLLTTKEISIRNLKYTTIGKSRIMLWSDALALNLLMLKVQVAVERKVT